MEKFTNRFVPETSLHGASNAIIMEEDNRNILELLKALVEVIESDIPTDLELAVITVIVILIILQLGISLWQTRATQLQIESVVQDMSQQLEELQQAIKDAEVKEAKMISIT